MECDCLEIQAAVQIHRSYYVLQSWNDTADTCVRLPWSCGWRSGSHRIALRNDLLLPVRSVLARLASVGRWRGQVAVGTRERQRRGSSELLGLGRSARVGHVRLRLHVCVE